jgi:hypothetical protein
MRKFTWGLSCVGLLLLLLSFGYAQGDETSNLQFKVIKDYNDKPVKNASVVLHPVNSHGQQSRGGYELKTDENGLAAFPGVPYGTLRVQVLVLGFQTFGEDYAINKPETEIVVRLKRPQSQYSIYPGDAGKDAPKEAPKDPSKDSDNKPQ